MNGSIIGEITAKFADIIWENEPISSAELAKRAEALLGWKKSTSFTVLKRLSDKGIFKNENGVVTSLVSREEYFAIQSEQFVEQAFSGSLPAFIAAFGSRRPLSAKEADALRRLIDEAGEE